MGKHTTGSKSVLVPLTNSLYVSGELTSTETVLVDVGTGFMIEKVVLPSLRCAYAASFFIPQPATDS